MGFRYEEEKVEDLIDDLTRMTWVYPMKRRSEVPVLFGAWKAQAELESGEKLQRVRSVPYHPQQNGVAERFNQTVMGRVRAMLADAELPMRLWPEGDWTERPVQGGHLRAFGCVAYVHIPDLEPEDREDRPSSVGSVCGKRCGAASAGRTRGTDQY